VINKNHRTLYILMFDRSYDRNEKFLWVKEDEANKHKKHHRGAQNGCSRMVV